MYVAQAKVLTNKVKFTEKSTNETQGGESPEPSSEEADDESSSSDSSGSSDEDFSDEETCEKPPKKGKGKVRQPGPPGRGPVRSYTFFVYNLTHTLQRVEM